MYVCVYVCVCIYIYRERERERDLIGVTTFGKEQNGFDTSHVEQKVLIWCR